jgi:hypothetical protein
MKTLITMVTAAGLLAVGAGAASASYCSDQATHAANQRAAGSTIVGAGLGCLAGQLFAKKCGAGAAVGGIGGFAIGSSQWHQVYDAEYAKCVGPAPTKIKVKTISTVPATGTQNWLDDCDAKYKNFDRDTGYFSYDSYTGNTINKACVLP